MVHKEVFEFIEKEIKHSTKPIIIEATFLFETELYLLCDKTFYVTTPKKRQIANLSLRNDNIEKALKINANFNDENIKKATHVIINDKDVANLKKQVISFSCK